MRILTKLLKRKLSMNILIKNTVIAALLASTSVFAQNAEQIRIVGSSTVYPFTTTVAENFSKAGFKAPIVESVGTGGGMKLFCEGLGINTPDATNASRRMKQGEFEICAKNGVKDIVELNIGFDGLSFATNKKAQPLNLTRQQIFLALAKDVPDSTGKLVANPYKLWSEIDSTLPARKIEVMGPPPSSGTRDSLHELFLEEGALAIPAMKDLKKTDAKAFDKVWKSLRQDGAYIEAGENDNLIVQKLDSDVNLIGVFGFSFLEENSNKLSAVKLEGVEPTFDTIAEGKYKASRAMYVYFKKEHLTLRKGLGEFMSEFVSNKAMGQNGYLEKKGLVVLPKAELEKVRTAIVAKTTLDGASLPK
jgi:phosphate transport system substrate-binding protein